ncbi:MAG: hypothetical protein ACK5H1_05835 [Tenacibaculum sp.]
MRWHKFISTLLHPFIIPTVGLFFYLIFIPISLTVTQQLTILSIVFISTYVIPLLLLVFLKAVGYIDSAELFDIKERKVILFIVINLMLLVAALFKNLSIVSDLRFLFYGAALGLAIVYLLFFAKLKCSLHLFAMGAMVGYFLVFQQIHQINTIFLIAALLIISGFLASSRLSLKTCIPTEVYTGFFIGFTSQLIAYIFL